MAKRLESEGEKEFASSGVVTITTITTALEMRQRDKGDLFDSQNVLRNLVSFSFSFSSKCLTQNVEASVSTIITTLKPKKSMSKVFHQLKIK